MTKSELLTILAGLPDHAEIYLSTTEGDHLPFTTNIKGGLEIVVGEIILTQGGQRLDFNIHLMEGSDQINIDVVDP